jgi:hypothetical protein
MTLRDYFAAKALVALISKVPVETTDDKVTSLVLSVVAGAYDYADAMLKERAK